jgi:SAM-dependent methyltransferase
MCGHRVEDARVLGMRLNRSQGLKPRARTGIAVSILKCAECGLNFCQPLPVPRSIDDHYGLPAEDYWREEYFKKDPTYFAKQIGDAKRLLKFTPGMKALDIGAGVGKAMMALTMAGFAASGIEPSATFRKKAIERTGIDPQSIFEESIESASFPANHFDFITFGAVLEHLYDPAEAIRRAMAWLRPGGVMQMEVPSSRHLMPTFINAYFRLRGTNFVTNLSPMHPPYHLYAFTLDSFDKCASTSGFEVVHSYIDVASIRHVPRFLKPILRSWMNWRGTGMQLTVWIRKK